jgi:hypothetical protein
MPLHIKDPAAEAAVRRLAKLRGITLTEAVRVACEAAAMAAANDDSPRTGYNESRLQALRAVQQRFREMAPGRTPMPGKAFYDDLYDEA